MLDYRKLDSITVIDFETASSAYYSACSIGIVLIRDGIIVDKLHYLIQPPENYFEKTNIELHGITPEQTINTHIFPEVWENIKTFFDGSSYIAAHNANFDMTVLKATLDYYNIQQPDFLFMCSIPISGLNIPTGENIERTLEARCAYYDIPLPAHHNALCDAEACANLILYAFSHSRYKTIGTFVKMRVDLKQYESVKIKRTASFGFHKNIDIKEIAATTEKTAPNDIIAGKVFVFTGELKRLTREQAMQKVIAAGGTVKNGISKKVDFLVNAETTITNKVQAALDLQSEGHRIKIITDEEFMKMLAGDVQ